VFASEFGKIEDENKHYILTKNNFFSLELRRNLSALADWFYVVCRCVGNVSQRPVRYLRNLNLLGKLNGIFAV